MAENFPGMPPLQKKSSPLFSTIPASAPKTGNVGPGQGGVKPLSQVTTGQEVKIIPPRQEATRRELRKG